MNILPYLLIGVFLLSCGSRQESEPKPGLNLLQIPVTTKDGAADKVSDEFQLREDYKGANLKLYFPHETNLGRITLDGETAKMLFAHMKIQAVDGTKTGPHLACTASACKLEIDYASLNVVERKGEIQKDKTLEDLRVNYSSRTLVMDAKTKKARVILWGNDAKVLFLSTEVQAKDTEAFTKKAKAIDCRHFKTTDEYNCSFALKFEKGEIE